MFSKRSFLYALVIMIWSCTASAQSSTCNITQIDAVMSGQGFQLLNVQGQPCGRYYYNSTSTINWNTAATQAAAVGATLVTIRDQAENDAVWQAAVQAGVSGGVWIGYTDRVTEGTWRWEDGSTGIFTNWNSSEPSNNVDICSSSGEDAAVMQMNNGRWNDVYVDPVFPCLFPPSYKSIIKVNLCPVAMVNDAAVCGSQPVALTASAMLGSPAYSYSWNSGEAVAAITVTPSATSDYIVTATDRYECSALDTATVTLALVAAPAISISIDSVCENSSVQVSYAGSASPTAFYTWNFDGANVISGGDEGPYNLEWTTAGTKTITLIINDNGCASAQGATSIEVKPGVVADAGRDTVVCQGAAVQLNATPNGIGYTYAWFPASGLNDALIPNPVLGGVFGNVSCGVIISNGACSDTDFVNINVVPFQLITLDTSGPLTFCGGGSVTLSVDGSYSSYVWSSGDNTPTLNITFPGNFYLEAYDSSGCRYNSDTVMVSTSGLLTVATDSVANPACFGMENGSISITASGGTAPYTYSLDGVNYQSNGTFSDLAPASYTVNVRDAGGCTNDPTTITLTAPTEITANYSITQTQSATSEGAIKVNQTGGTAPYTYSLDGVNYQSSGTFTDLAAASYQITVRDVYGCVFTDTVTIEGITGLPALAANTFSVYPNPVSDFIQVRFISPVLNGSLALYDIHGALLFHRNVGTIETRQDIAIDMQALPRGMYMLQVLTEGRVGVVKILVD